MTALLYFMAVRNLQRLLFMFAVLLRHLLPLWLAYMLHALPAPARTTLLQPQQQQQPLRQY
jgi:hypothetical protein